MPRGKLEECLRSYKVPCSKIKTVSLHKLVDNFTISVDLRSLDSEAHVTCYRKTKILTTAMIT